MTERHCNTFADVKDLLADFEVRVELCAGGVIQFKFPFEGKWKEKRYSDTPRPYVGDGSFDECSGVNFNRACTNTVRSLIASEQFWRCTTVADRFSEFAKAGPTEWYNGKRKGEPLVMGIVKCTKKGGEPFTVHFESPAAAGRFYEALK